MDFIYCDLTRDFAETLPMLDALQCLQKAMHKTPEIIIIRFGRISRKETDRLLELISILKESHVTRAIPVLVLLTENHRILLEQLNRVQADYVIHIGHTELNPGVIDGMLARLDDNDRTAVCLAAVCPYIHYDRINATREIIVCRAYLNRLVLAGHRLHEICETVNHQSCEYFLNPRIKHEYTETLD